MADETRATRGQTVMVILDHIMPDKQTEYEHFLHGVLLPGLARLSPTEQAALSSIRLLHPAAANEDGTLTYCFLIDPVVEGADYSLQHALEEMYGEDAERYYALWQEAHGRPQEAYELHQT